MLCGYCSIALVVGLDFNMHWAILNSCEYCYGCYQLRRGSVGWAANRTPGKIVCLASLKLIAVFNVMYVFIHICCSLEFHCYGT
jgi:hypothetical protein